MVVVMSWVVLSADGMASADGAVSWVALSVDGTVWHCLQVPQAVGRLGPLACGLACDILCKRCQTGSWRQSARGSGIGCRLLSRCFPFIVIQRCFAWSSMELGQKGVGRNLDVKESPASKPAGESPLLVAISCHQHF